MGDFRSHADRILDVSMRTFGETVTFYPKSAPTTGYTGKAVFDNEHRAIDPNTQEVISVNQPSLGVNLNDYAIDLRQGDQVEVRGIRFSIADKREDGLGGALLFLNKVRASDRISDTRAP